MVFILRIYVGLVAIFLGTTGLMGTNRKPAQLGRYVDKAKDWYLRKWWHQIFLFCEAFRPPLETIQRPVPVTTGDYFPRVKGFVRENDHSVPSSDEVKKEWP